MYTEAEDPHLNEAYPTMQGKIVLITGATSGIGEATALALAEKGATVVVAGRDASRAESTVSKIRQTSSNQSVDYLLADLSALDQVHKLAAEFQERYDRLDVLINNAGAVYFRRQISVDGYEMTFALNHLSYFLLTKLLLDRLKTTADSTGEARIVNVSSEAHRGAKILFDDLMFERRSYGPGGFRAYGQSKLANLLFTFELARRLDGSPVLSNALHPGLVASNIGKNNGTLGQLYASVSKRLGISAGEGAQTVIYLASWPEVKGVTQKYYRQCQSIEADSRAYDLESARKLWEISEALVA